MSSFEGTCAGRQDGLPLPLGLTRRHRRSQLQMGDDQVTPVVKSRGSAYAELIEEHKKVLLTVVMSAR